MKKTKIHLRSLPTTEKCELTNVLSFLWIPKSDTKRYLANLANNLYARDINLELVALNGHLAPECRASSRDKNFYNLVQFKKEDLTPPALQFLGENNSFDWQHFYAISICREDRELYLISFSNACSPNWRDEYNVQRCMKLQDVDFGILKHGSYIYRMDAALHKAISKDILREQTTFCQEGKPFMVVMDQYGNRAKICGDSIDAIFRDYADNYTDYRDYRHQSASEWEIVNHSAREMFTQWKKTATGLKSSFDKFYRGGIVD